MYKLPYYTETDDAKVLDFMKANSFAMVVAGGDEYPVASHFPLDIEEQNGKIILSGHLMKKTDHHRAFEKNDHVLVIFNSPHAFVNAAWYENPSVGSTVNYIAVHASGILRFTDDAGTYDAVKRITEKHVGNEGPGSFSTLTQEYIDAMIKAIVGFHIEITKIENVFKLSQNRHLEDRKNIIAKLEERNLSGDLFIAEEMKRRLIADFE